MPSFSLTAAGTHKTIYKKTKVNWVRAAMAYNTHICTEGKKCNNFISAGVWLFFQLY